MALLFARRLAMPVWAIVFAMVFLSAPAGGAGSFMAPAMFFVVAISGVALIVLAIGSSMPRLRRSRVAPPGRSSLDERHRRTADDALDAARMDDDGGG